MSTTLTKPQTKRDFKPIAKPRTRAESPKNLVKSLINRLPDDVTWEQILYHIYVLEKLEEGERQCARGEFYSLEETEHKLAKWLKS